MSVGQPNKKKIEQNYIFQFNKKKSIMTSKWTTLTQHEYQLILFVGDGQRSHILSVWIGIDMYIVYEKLI